MTWAIVLPLVKFPNEDIARYFYKETPFPYKLFRVGIHRFGCKTMGNVLFVSRLDEKVKSFSIYPNGEISAELCGAHCVQMACTLSHKRHLPSTVKDPQSSARTRVNLKEVSFLVNLPPLVWARVEWINPTPTIKIPILTCKPTWSRSIVLTEYSVFRMLERLSTNPISISSYYSHHKNKIRIYFMRIQ